MNHRYSHIRNIDDLDREIALLRIRKDVIRAEAFGNIESFRDDTVENIKKVSSTFRLVKSLFTLLRPAPASGTIDRIAQVASAVGTLAGAISGIRKRGQ